jgi:putative flippase GtrA
VNGSTRRWPRTEAGSKHLRYVAASGTSVAAGQIVLALCFGVARWPAEASNLVAFAAGAVVSYTLNRRWTWKVSGRSRFLGEIVPFSALAAAGLLISTVAVAFAEDAAPRITPSRTGQTLIVMGAALAAYGVVWIVKFVVLDRYLFGVDRRPATDRSAC